VTAGRCLAGLLAAALGLMPGAQAAAHFGGHGKASLRKPGAAVKAGPQAAAPKLPGAGAAEADVKAGVQGAEAGKPLQSVLGKAGIFTTSACPECAASEGPAGGASLEAAKNAVISDGRLVFDGDIKKPESLGAKFLRWSGYHHAVDLAREPFVSRRVDALLDQSLPAEKRARAALSLARWQRIDASAALSTAVHDENPLVARAARMALRRLGVRPAEGLYEAPAYEFEDARRPVQMAALKKVIGVAVVFAAIEGFGGFTTGLSSLIADTMHLTADIMISAGALYALWAAGRRPDHMATYGSLKLEPMVGFIASMLIPALAIFAGFEAWGRFQSPGAVAPLQTMLFAAAGLASNAFSTAVLYRMRGDGVGLRGAFLHAVGDALGSLGIIFSVAAGWTLTRYGVDPSVTAAIDPIVTVGIIGLILKTSWGLMRDSWRMLMDTVPQGVDLQALADDLARVPGVAKVHDLHVWQASSSLTLATGKLNAEPGADLEGIRQAAKAVFAEHGAAHVTVEVRAARP
jgi:cobalt-zinc-cadmium efflux system protein